MSDVNILTLFGINIEELEKYEMVDSSSESVSFLVRKNRDIYYCPECGSTSIKIKDYKSKRYRFLSHTGIEVNIIFEHRRYVCDDCHKTFLEKNPFIKNHNYKISPNKILEVINYLKDNIPVSLIAKYSFISVSSINNILDKTVKVKRRRLPEIINIDEVSSFNSDVNSKYACVLLDYQRGCIIDVLPSRRSDWLSQYLSQIPFDEMKNVRYIVMDMYQPYMDCFKRFNKDITFVIDPFHYVRCITDAIERVRLRVMKRFLTSEVEYKLLKKYRRLLLTKYEPDTYRKLKRLQILNDRRMYDSDILLQLLSVDKDIEEAYFLGHDFMKELDRLDYDRFKEFLSLTIGRFKSSSLLEFRKVGDTYDHWREEICNSYLLVDNGKRLSNGRLEGRNNKIKTLKKSDLWINKF